MIKIMMELKLPIHILNKSGFYHSTFIFIYLYLYFLSIIGYIYYRYIIDLFINFYINNLNDKY